MLCLAGKVHLAIIRFGYFDVGGRPGKCKNMIKIFATLSKPQQKGALLGYVSLTLVNFPPCDFDHFTPYFGQLSPLRLTLLPPVK